MLSCLPGRLSARGHIASAGEETGTMYMGQVDTSTGDDLVRDLKGARILLTGLTSTDGVDIARAFAELRTRLIVHTNDLSSEVIELVALLSQSAGEIKLHTHDISSAQAAAAFSQSSAQAFGGLDAAINIASISNEEIAALRKDGDLESLVSSKLAPLAQLTRVVANRMSLVFSDGLILNVFKMPHPETARQSAVAGFVRTALAAMVATEANDWADKGIRINAVGPRVVTFGEKPAGAYLSNEPDVASLALHLASRRGRTLSGHVFDADGLTV